MTTETRYALRRAAWLAAGVAGGQLVMAILAVGVATMMEAAGFLGVPVVQSLRGAFGSAAWTFPALGGLYLATVGLGFLALEARRGARLHGPGDLRPARTRISTAGRLILRRAR